VTRTPGKVAGRTVTQNNHQHKEILIARKYYQVDSTRINERIRVPQVRLITEEGKQLGIVPTKQALEEADRRGLDLVEVAPNAQPPVCRIMDYGKYRYEQTKREREARHHSHHVKTKEVKFRPSIGEHDFEYKRNHIIEFLQQGHRVKVTCFHRGREAAHQEIGQEKLKQLIEDMDEYGAIEMPLKRMGSSYSVIFGPKKAKGGSKH
jgi:translation initiation factor IF-3